MGSVENSHESVGRAIEQLDDLMDELGVDLEKRAPQNVQQGKSGMAQQNGHSNSAALRSEKSSEDVLDSLAQKMTSALGSLGGDDHDVDTCTKDERVNTVFGDCAVCGDPIGSEASVVGKKHFHPHCFVCEKCGEPLGTTQYFIIGGKNYCERDSKEFLERCCKCGDPIRGDMMRPKETGRPFHPECFRCDDCRRPIDKRYYSVDGRTVCHDDYVASREKCAGCSDPILETTLKALDRSYHPQCFTCSHCPLSLDGIQFFISSDKAICGTCYARTDAKKCRQCSSAILEDCLVSRNGQEYFHKGCYKDSERTKN